MHIPNLSKIFVFFLFFGLFIGPQALSNSESTGENETVEPGFENLLNAVVRIDVREASYNGGAKRTIRGVGSGVILTEQGHILTNAHVVSPEAEEISVTLASLERVDATLIGWDHWTDLALLQLDMAKVTERNLTFSIASFGNSEDTFPRQEVFAVGTPNGLTRTVTRGIISNTKRYFAGSESVKGHETGYFHTWLQTDAAINPGNSGGPLVNDEGEVIGINTRGYLGANNLGFAVPAAIAHVVMESLLREGEVSRSYIGIRPAPLRDLENFYGLEANTGMLVNSVDPGSPADEAGLQPGNIILEINGNPIDGRFPEQLPAILNSIAILPVGTELTMKVINNDERRDIEVTTELLETRVGEKWAFEDWGFSVEKVTRALARERKLESSTGVLVSGTQPAFPAAKANLRAGDIIIKVQNRTIDTLDNLKAIYEQYVDNPESLLVEINRYHRKEVLLLKP